VCLSSVADARPRHPSLQKAQTTACDAMRPCYANGRPLYGKVSGLYEHSDINRPARAGARKPRRAPPGLARVMAEGAGRALGRPRAWCGWWLGRHLGMLDRKLWLAANWARVGRPAHGPAVGAVVVWRHHVGIITGRSAHGWIVKSGNDGHRVRERPRSVAGAIAFRWPGA
jgi:hypothetical protein